MHLVDKTELRVIVGNDYIIVPFDLEHIAGHLFPRCGWHIVSEERLLTMLLRLALLADCTAFHHRLRDFVDVWPIPRHTHYAA